MSHIKTWGERAAEKFQADQILYEEAKQQTVIDCMRAEISELRAELARRTQPEATAPAQDLSAAILALPIPTHWMAHQAVVMGYMAALKDAAALASSANALGAGDRVDAEPRAIRDANGELVGIARRSCDPGVKSNLESSGDKND